MKSLSGYRADRKPGFATLHGLWACSVRDWCFPVGARPTSKRKGLSLQLSLGCHKGYCSHHTPYIQPKRCRSRKQPALRKAALLLGATDGLGAGARRLEWGWSLASPPGKLELAMFTSGSSIPANLTTLNVRDGGTLYAACSCGFDFGEDCSFFSTSIFSTGSVGANQAKCMSLYFRLSM